VADDPPGVLLLFAAASEIAARAALRFRGWVAWSRARYPDAGRSFGNGRAIRHSQLDRKELFVGTATAIGCS
jgi:hypothetical protein